MAKKKENFYFTNFVECIRVSEEAAEKLKEILQHYDVSKLKESVDAMHKVEHKGDDKKHEMGNEIVKDFITPLERDDLMKISQYIDNVTDSIEDIVIGLYTWNVETLRPDVMEFTEIILESCRAAEKVLAELPDYRKSKVMHDYIVELNQLEEKGDRLYIQCLRSLSLEKADPCTVMAWREIYRSFENVCDCCEDVADVVASIVISNT